MQTVLVHHKEDALLVLLPAPCMPYGVGSTSVSRTGPLQIFTLFLLRKDGTGGDLPKSLQTAAVVWLFHEHPGDLHQCGCPQVKATSHAVVFHSVISGLFL